MTACSAKPALRGFMVVPMKRVILKTRASAPPGRLDDQCLPDGLRSKRASHPSFEQKRGIFSNSSKPCPVPPPSTPAVRDLHHQLSFSGLVPTLPNLRHDTGLYARLWITWSQKNLNCSSIAPLNTATASNVRVAVSKVRRRSVACPKAHRPHHVCPVRPSLHRR